MAVFLFPQGLTVPSESSSAAPQRKTHQADGAVLEDKGTGGVRGAKEAAFSEGSGGEEEGESRGGKKTPRWWVPERLRSSPEVRLCSTKADRGLVVVAVVVVVAVADSL